MSGSWALEDRGYNRAKVRHFWIPCDPPPWAHGFPDIAAKQWHQAACGQIGGKTQNPLKVNSRARKCHYCDKLHPEED